MRFNLTLSHKGLILVGIPLVFELAFVGLLSWQLAQSEFEREREIRAREVIAHASNTQTLLTSTLLSLTSHVAQGASADVADRLTEVRAKTSEEFRSLHALVKGYPKEEQMIDRLESTTQVGLAKYKEVDAAFSEGRLLAGYRKLSELKPILGDMQDLLDKVVEQLRQITSASLATEAETRERIQFLLLGGIVLNIMIAVGLAIYFNRGTARRLAILMDNTARLAKHQVLNPPVPGSDEIAHLDRVFHDMSTDLAQAERAKQEYVAMISHDLRSPLTSIQFILTMIAGGTYGNLSESGVSRAKAAESSAERLINLINTLLDLEKMEAGMLNMQLADVSLSTIVKRSVEAIDSLAEQAGINVEVQQADVNVKADADRLVQVLVNLVSNAIKFSPKGSSIAISIKNVPNFVEVRVTDQGRGIPADQLSSVFDRFQQVEESDSRKKGGTGLGLAICKAIIEGHGGTIGIESELGKGSTFWFRIPAWPAG